MLFKEKDFLLRRGAAVIYLLPKVIKNEQCQQIPSNFVKFLNLKMEKWLNEQIGEEKTEVGYSAVHKRNNNVRREK